MTQIYYTVYDMTTTDMQVLEKKKQDLLAKYSTEEFRSQQEEAKSLLNKK